MQTEEDNSSTPENITLECHAQIDSEVSLPSVSQQPSVPTLGSAFSTGVRRSLRSHVEPDFYGSTSGE